MQGGVRGEATKLHHLTVGSSWATIRGVEGMKRSGSKGSWERFNVNSNNSHGYIGYCRR